MSTLVLQISRLAFRLACSVGIAIAAVPAFSGTLILEGSDATGVHGTQAGGFTYTTQLFTYMKGASSLPVTVFGSAGNTPSTPAGTLFTSNLSTLSTTTSSALYIASPGGCCDQNLAGVLTYQTQIAAFFAAGGSVAIQDYQGGNWGWLSPLLVAPPSGTIDGYNTGGSGPSCVDGEKFNTEALSRGFTQPPALGCWQHQAYKNSYFVDTLGFLSLVDADPSYFGATVGDKATGSALLAFGGALGTSGCTDPTGATCGSPVPVPGALALVLAGLAGFGVSRRKL